MLCFFFVSLTVFLVYHISPPRVVRGAEAWCRGRGVRGPGAGSSGSSALQPPGAPTAALQRCTTTGGAGHPSLQAATPAHRLLQGARVDSVCTGAVWTLDTDHRCKPESPLVCRHDNDTAQIHTLQISMMSS